MIPCLPAELGAPNVDHPSPAFAHGLVGCRRLESIESGASVVKDLGDGSAQGDRHPDSGWFELDCVVPVNYLRQRIGPRRRR